MWRIGLLAITACWTRTTPAEMPAPSANAACEIRDKNIVPSAAFKLHAGGISFATINSELARFDVVLDGTTARAQLETAALELTGELDVVHLPLRKRGGLHDDWIGINEAHVRVARDGIVEVSIPLPEGARPPAIIAKLACADVTFQTAGYADDTFVTSETPDYIQLVLPESTVLARTPNGPALLELVAGRTLTTEILEQRGGSARVAIFDKNTLVGWIPAQHIAVGITHPNQAVGVGRYSESRRSVQCTHDVPIYVDTGAKVHRVGRYKTGATILFEGPSLDDPGVVDEKRLRVDLGDGDVEPHVERADLVGCARH